MKETIIDSIRSKLKNRLAHILFSCLLLPGLLISEKAPIRSASEIDYPPFCFQDSSGQAYGFSVELMRSALEAMNYEVTFRTGVWADVRNWLEQGDIDALPLVGRTPERESVFDFTFPDTSLHGAIVVRENNKDIRRFRDLRGKHVAVMQGDNAKEFLQRQNIKMNIHSTLTFDQALRELSQGQYDAVVIQRLVALRIIQENNYKNLNVIDKPITDFRQDFCFAVQEGDRETLALLNEGLAIVMADGTFRHLHAKWFASMQLPKHQSIIVGGDHNFPPFEYLDENGEPAGYNVDLTRAISRATGLDIEIRLGPWTQIRDALADGEIDALQGMFYSAERDLDFDFSPAHTIAHMVSIVRQKDSPPGSIEELENKDIVVQRGDIMHDYVRENNIGRTVTALDTQEDALRQLTVGKHDCALGSRLAALYWINQNSWKNLTVGQQPLLEYEYCYAVPENHQALLAKFTEGLNMLEDSGEYRRIHQKWLGVYKDNPRSILDILRYSAWFLLPLLAILLIIFLWSWSLRKTVAQRTEELRKSLETQRAMLACSPVALFSVDSEGRVQEWNASAERVLGWNADETLGKPLPIVPKDKQEEFQNLRKKVMNNQSLTDLHVIRQKKDGSRFHASLSVAPVYDAKDQIIGIMASVEDITGRISAKRRIEHLNRVLLAIRDINQLIVRERDRIP
ncbi:MAG: transporter substrate-binding domain-containing protein [candidate division KSB1 bacterium]|nr:transporter substrate-binding domain-containing protein [candidate division KSB1 bacterium]